MDTETEKITILKYNEAGGKSIEDVVVREFPLTIVLNNRELVTMLCTPKDFKYLAVGFLASEGLITSKEDIKKVLVDDRRGIVRVETVDDLDITDEIISKRLITSGCGRGASFYRASDARYQETIDSQIKISTAEITSLVRDFQGESEVYRATGGVHSCALCDTKTILVFSEDIGRHNAVDKIFGKCLLEDIPTADRIIVTSGRISSEILLKVAKRNIPIIISKSAPTDLSLKLATELGVTLLGFVRGSRMNAYTNDWRVTADA